MTDRDDSSSMRHVCYTDPRPNPRLERIEWRSRMAQSREGNKTLTAERSLTRATPCNTEFHSETVRTFERAMATGWQPESHRDRRRSRLRANAMEPSPARNMQCEAKHKHRQDHGKNRSFPERFFVRREPADHGGPSRSWSEKIEDIGACCFCGTCPGRLSQCDSVLR